MAKLLIEIPDELMPRVVAGVYRFKGQVPKVDPDAPDDPAKSETDATFLQRICAEFLGNMVVGNEAEIAAQAAEAAKKEQVKTDVDAITFDIAADDAGEIVVP